MMIKHKTENNMSSSGLTRRSRNKDLRADWIPDQVGDDRRMESGRSMVEMLGVLAVIGVLSVVGVWMYLYLMGVYKENETLNIIDKVAVGAYTSNDKEGGESEEIGRMPADGITSGVTQIDAYTLDTPLKTRVSAYRLSGGVYEVELKNVSYAVCERVLNDTADYISAYLDRASGEGVYIGDTEEDKTAFCERVDSLKRERPYIRTAIENPDANMILCYSLDGESCDIPYTPPPPPTDRACGTVAHGEKYNDCGLCNNGMYIMGEAPSNPCVRCDAETDYKFVSRTGSDCQDACHKCDATGACVAKEADKPEACGEVCCPEGQCNRTRTGCKKECSGCNTCQMCDTDSGECIANVLKNNESVDACNVCFEGAIEPVSNGSNKQSDGRCCHFRITGIRRFFIPRRAIRTFITCRTVSNGFRCLGILTAFLTSRLCIALRTTCRTQCCIIL